MPTDHPLSPQGAALDILVFGKTGQVATELQRQGPLGAAGHNLVALGRDEADLSDPEACAAQIRAHSPQVVINAAAYTAVDRAEEEEDLATTVNGAAPGAMAEACATLGIPFLHVSTDYVFDGSGTQPWVETAPVGPLGAYGRSKLVGEQKVQASGATHAILRTSWVFSAHGGNFVKTMLRLSESRDHLTVVADQIGGPTPAADIAATLLQMAEIMVDRGGAAPGGIFHYGGAPAVSWAEFAREIFARAGRDVRVEDIPTSGYPTPAARPLNSRLDGAALQAAFGIAPPDWRAGLHQVLVDLGAV